MIFVDTSGWVALVDQRDGNHPAAVEFRTELAHGRHGQLVTTDYVLDESASYIKRRAGSDALRAFRLAIEASESVRIVWTVPESFWQAWDRLARSRDKDWSFTDCLSFHTMDSLAIVKAFAFDSDFEQAGFTLLPKAQR